MSHPEKKPGFPAMSAYRRTEVMTANRETILLMMYSAAIRFVRSALEAVQAGDPNERNRFITRAQEIVSELRSTLDFKVGGEIAANLDKLYDFISGRLILASVEQKPEYLQEALNVLETLNTAWEEAIASLRKERAAPTPKTGQSQG